MSKVRTHPALLLPRIFLRQVWWPSRLQACAKKDDEKACCLHCQADHPASFRGCPAYKKAKAQQAPKLRNIASNNKSSFELPNIANVMSYRDALNGTHKSQAKNPCRTTRPDPTSRSADMTSSRQTTLLAEHAEEQLHAFQQDWAQ